MVRVKFFRQINHKAARLWVFVLALAIGPVGWAQHPNYLTVYQPYINEAELAIIDGNYLMAIEAYEKAFEGDRRGFMKDYFNAAVCATYSGNADKTYFYLLKVASKGISLDFVKNEVAFMGIQRDSLWRDFELKYLEEKRKFDAHVDTSLQDLLTRLMNRDAWFREKNAVTFADTIAVIDAENALVLEKVIEEKGFPGEDEIGCGENGMPVIQFPFYTLMRRQAGDNQTVNFSNQLIKAAQQGKILPHFATHIMATLNANDVFFSRYLFKIVADDTPAFQDKPFSNKLNKWVYVAIDKEQEQTINELRLSNGMETLADYRKKILFSLNDHRFLFPYRSLAGMWYVTDPETAEIYLEGTVLAE